MHEITDSPTVKLFMKFKWHEKVVMLHN